MAREIKKQISSFLRELLQEQHKNTGQPKNKLIALELIRIALDEKSTDKLKMEAIEMIMDRIEGKAVNTTVNAEMGVNPLESIPTEVLEALKAKAEALKNSQ